MKKLLLTAAALALLLSTSAKANEIPAWVTNWLMSIDSIQEFDVTRQPGRTTDISHELMQDLIMVRRAQLKGEIPAWVTNWLMSIDSIQEFDVTRQPGRTTDISHELMQAMIRVRRAQLT